VTFSVLGSIDPFIIGYNWIFFWIGRKDRVKAVNHFAETNIGREVREIQQEIIKSYII
jgi:hypothetical protein